ncbi:MAG: LPS translocon maturation chaperone LptM [Marinomonas sp.]|nr:MULTISPECIES: lipoprotein [unclassified Marinomonas]
MSRLIALVFVTSLLIACGNKGALYLPTADNGPAQPSQTNQ